MIENKFRGFICKKVTYSEADCIISVLSEEAKEVFKAKGINKITSKNGACCNYFLIGEYVVTSKTEKSNKTLKSASIYKIYKRPFEDLLTSSVYLLICSMLDQVSDQINGYSLAIKCFDCLENGAYPINVANYFLKNLCETLGYQSNLNGCINCNTTNNLVSFDFESGGFICASCFDASRYEKLTASFLADIYKFLKTDELIELEELRANKLFNMYQRFIKEVIGLNINNFDFVNKCLS